MASGPASHLRAQVLAQREEHAHQLDQVRRRFWWKEVWTFEGLVKDLAFPGRTIGLSALLRELAAEGEIRNEDKLWCRLAALKPVKVKRQDPREKPEETWHQLGDLSAATPTAMSAVRRIAKAMLPLPPRSLLPVSEQSLSSPKRVIQFVKRHPGCTTAQLLRGAGVRMWAVRNASRDGHIRSERNGKRSLWYPPMKPEGG